MNKTQIIKELTELFDLAKDLNKPCKDDDVVFPFEEMAIERPERILGYFGLTPSERIDKVFDKFLEKDELSAESLAQVITDLSQIAVEHLSKPVLQRSKSYQPQKNCAGYEKDTSTPDIVGEMRAYVMKDILIPLSDEEFRRIEEGFRLRWNYSTGQMGGDCDFNRAVDQYLTSIEFQIGQKKIRKAVDLILEYMEEIGRWS